MPRSIVWNAPGQSTSIWKKSSARTCGSWQFPITPSSSARAAPTSVRSVKRAEQRETVVPTRRIYTTLFPHIAGDALSTLRTPSDRLSSPCHWPSCHQSRTILCGWWWLVPMQIVSILKHVHLFFAYRRYLCENFSDTKLDNIQNELIFTHFFKFYCRR